MAEGGDFDGGPVDTTLRLRRRLLSRTVLAHFSVSSPNFDGPVRHPVPSGCGVVGGHATWRRCVGNFDWRRRCVRLLGRQARGRAKIQRVAQYPLAWTGTATFSSPRVWALLSSTSFPPTSSYVEPQSLYAALGRSVLRGQGDGERRASRWRHAPAASAGSSTRNLESDRKRRRRSQVPL